MARDITYLFMCRHPEGLKLDDPLASNEEAIGKRHRLKCIAFRY